MSAIIGVVKLVIISPLKYLAKFASWFYLTFIPFFLQYIGIPMFVLGILLSLSYALGVVLFIFVFYIFMNYFIKGTIFNTQPIIK